MDSAATPHVPVDAWTDFTCPYSFVVSLSLRRLRGETGVELRWRSMLVHPPGLPPLSQTLRAQAQAGRSEMAVRAQEEFGLELKPGPIETDTLSAHLALKHCERRGVGDAFHLLAMRAFWLEAVPLGERARVEQLAAKAGAPDVAWDDPALAEAVDADIGLAQSHDLFFVPALVFGGRHVVSGAEPYEHLLAVARLAAASSQAAARTEVHRPPYGPSSGLGAPL